MVKAKLEKYLGKVVTVTLFDGDAYTGVLRKTGTDELKTDPNLYLPKGRYFIDMGNEYSSLFRSSHIVKFKEGKA